MSYQFCRVCKFWRDNHSDRDGAGEWDDGAGECRRYPPLITGKHERGGVVAAFPQTTRHDWCGEFKPDKRREDMRETL